MSQSNLKTSYVEARQTLLDFFADGRAVRDDAAIALNTKANCRGHRRQLLFAFHSLLVEGLIVSSPKRLLAGAPSPNCRFFHLRPDLLTPVALEHLQTLVVLPAPVEVRS